MVKVLKGPCKSVWTNSRGLDARVLDGGNGFAFILPDRHGSQMGSGDFLDLISIPVTRILVLIYLTELWSWCARRRCQSEISSGRVEI